MACWRLTLAVMVVSMALGRASSAFQQCTDHPSCECAPVAGPPSDVIRLRCENQGLKAVPAFLSDYLNLHGLYLKNNAISAVPSDGFIHVSKLRELSLNSNLLTSFPAEALTPLTHLRLLDLSNNLFLHSNVPVNAFAHMAGLEDLRLTARLSFDANRPSGLNITFEHLKNQGQLRLLDVDNNPLTGRNMESWGSVEAGHFSHLRQISAVGVVFTRIPPFVADLTQLEMLNIDFNGITMVEKGDIPNGVNRLDLSLNQITSLPNGAIPPSVSSLSLFGNPIREVDLQVFRRQSDLSDLLFTNDESYTACSLQNGTVTCDCAAGLYRSLRGDACTVCPEHVPGFPDSPCTSGEEGHLCFVVCGSSLNRTSVDADSVGSFICSEDGSWFTFSPPADCSGVVCGTDSPCKCSGTSVDCSNVGLTAIPSGFPTTATDIDLSHNEITVVPPDSFKGLTALESLDLSRNRISTLAHQAFAGLSSLRTLDLSHNSITGLDGLPFGEIHSIDKLNLARNDINFVSEPGTLAGALDNLADAAWVDVANDTDTKILNMADNPLICKLVTLDLGGEVYGLVKCDCPALGSSDLPFCPSKTNQYRFQCDAGDNAFDVPSTSVCDGVNDCQPSGIDEAVCEGILDAESANEPLCLAMSSALVDTCPDAPYGCFKTLDVSVKNGIANFRSAIPCGQQLCPPGFGLVTARGTFIGAGEGYTFKQQGTELSTRVRLDLNEGNLIVTCEFDHVIVSGMPAGIINPPPATTASSAKMSTSVSATGSSTLIGPTSPFESTPSPSASNSDSVGIAVGVGVVFAVIIVVLLIVFLRRRQSSNKVAATMLSSLDFARTAKDKFYAAHSRSVKNQTDFERSFGSLVSDGVGVSVERVWAHDLNAYNDATTTKGSLKHSMVTIKAATALPTLCEVTLQGKAGQSYDGQTRVAKVYTGSDSSVHVSLLLEARRLVMVSRHPSIVSLLATVNVGNQLTALVFDDVQQSLRSLLRSAKGGSSESQRLDSAGMLEICKDIASAMAYLHSRDIIHRSLRAARIMVSSSGKVKLSGFDTLRDVYVTNEYVSLFRPQETSDIRWQSPEAAEDGIFTKASDVWSFGIVCWEVMTFGRLPYGKLSNSEVLAEMRQGRAPEPPSQAPTALQQISSACTKQQSHYRPAFATLELHLLSAWTMEVSSGGKRTGSYTDAGILDSVSSGQLQPLTGPSGGLADYMWRTKSGRRFMKSFSVPAGQQHHYRSLSHKHVAPCMLQSSSKGADETFTVLCDVTDALPLDEWLRRLSSQQRSASTSQTLARLVLYHLSQASEYLCARRHAVSTASSECCIVVGGLAGTTSGAEGGASPASELVARIVPVGKAGVNPNLAASSHASMFHDALALVLKSLGSDPGLQLLVQDMGKATQWSEFPLVESLQKLLCGDYSLECAWSQLQLVRPLGSGQFGDVSLMVLRRVSVDALAVQGSSASMQQASVGDVEAKMQTKFVAVKTLRNEECLAEFQQEMKMMLRLRHPNLVALLGVITQQRPQALLLEYMSHGTLSDWAETEAREAQPWQFVFIINQIACGMAELASLNIVHRDLACRNVLLGDNLQVKVSDYGLSRVMSTSHETEDYYKLKTSRPLPIRWMAPETLSALKCTTASDVWSYGCTVYELYTFGKIPFAHLGDEKLIRLMTSRDKEQLRLKAPANCPPSVRTLMAECCAVEPSARPTFSDIAERTFEQVLAQGSNDITNGFSVQQSESSIDETSV